MHIQIVRLICSKKINKVIRYSIHTFKTEPKGEGNQMIKITKCHNTSRLV